MNFVLACCAQVSPIHRHRVREPAEKIVTKVRKESSKVGLEINFKKTKTMITSRTLEGKIIVIKVGDEISQYFNKSTNTFIHVPKSQRRLDLVQRKKLKEQSMQR